MLGAILASRAPTCRDPGRRWKSASNSRSSHADSELLAFLAAYEVNAGVSFRVVLKVAPLIEFAPDHVARPRTKHHSPIILVLRAHG